MGLDQPVQAAYRDWAKGLFVGRTIEYSDAQSYECSAPCLGISYSSNREVTDELKEKYPATLSLAIGAAMIYLSVGVVVGVYAARYRGSFTDRALVTSTLVISAIPYYLIALLAWIFLTQKYSVFPDTELPTALRRRPERRRMGGRPAVALAGARPDQRDVVLALHPRADGRDPG